MTKQSYHSNFWGRQDGRMIGSQLKTMMVVMIRIRIRIRITAEQRWWWWLRASSHSLASMNLGFRKGAIRAKSWFSQNVDAFLHSSIINLKKKFQCLHFQLFQVWTIRKLYLSMILSDFVEKRKRGGKKHIPEKSQLLQWWYKMLILRMILSMMMQRSFPRVREGGCDRLWLLCAVNAL